MPRTSHANNGSKKISSKYKANPRFSQDASRAVTIVITSIIVLLFSIAAYYIYSWYGPQPVVVELSSSHHEKLREVFLESDPWVVLCAADDESIHPNFESAARRLKEVTKSGVIDCDKKLPSGKTVWKRFQLKRPKIKKKNKTRRPVVLIFANSRTPRVVPVSNSGSTSKLVKYIRGAVQVKHFSLSRNREFKSKCISQRHCALIAHKEKLSNEQKILIKDLMMKHRSIQFVSLNTSRYSLKHFAPNFKNKTQSLKSPKIVLFKRLRHTENEKLREAEKVNRKTTKKKNNFSLGYSTFNGSFDQNGIDVWMTSLEKEDAMKNFRSIQKIPLLVSKKNRNRGSQRQETNSNAGKKTDVFENNKVQVKKQNVRFNFFFT